MRVYARRAASPPPKLLVDLAQKMVSRQNLQSAMSAHPTLSPKHGPATPLGHSNPR